MNMSGPEFTPLGLEGVFEIRPARHLDQRGFFSEVWREDWQKKIGLSTHFLQDNHSYSKSRGVLRGLHFQRPPAAQDKLVRVARGSIFDVALDIRRGSPTFGKWAGVILSSSQWNQLFIPKGFAHGFVTLEDDTEVLYKVTALYSPEHDSAVRFDDPAVGINWPIDVGTLTVSRRDRSAPLLSEIDAGL